MTHTKRNLLIFQYQQSNADFYEQLTANNWKINIAHNFDEAFDLLTRKEFLVGLCLEFCNKKVNKIFFLIILNLI